MFEIKEHVDEHGGNAWFGSDFRELFEKAAYYAHEIMTHTATPDKLPNYISSLSGGGAAHTSKKGSKKKAKNKKKKRPYEGEEITGFHDASGPKSQFFEAVRVHGDVHLWTGPAGGCRNLPAVNF